jgi:hypothetical protein
MGNIENMTTIEKLHLAQKLLSDVYFDYQDKGAINSALSCADDCIWESINFIEKGI